MDKIKKTFTLSNVKTVLAWGFIILVAFELGVMTGWNLRSDDITRVKAEANALVQSAPVSKTEVQQ